MQLPAILAMLAIVAPALSTTADSSLYSNEAPLLWGPYRPNLYLGIRPRVPESLVAGLMWGKLNEQDKCGCLALRTARGVADWKLSVAPHGRAERWHGHVRLEYLRCTRRWNPDHTRRRKPDRHHDRVREEV